MGRGPDSLHRDDVYPRDNNWSNSNQRSLGFIAPDPRFITPAPVHPRVLPVEDSLRDCAGLSVKEFALFVVGESGEERTYTSASLTQYQTSIFGDRFRKDFRRAVRRIDRNPYSSGYGQDGVHSDFDVESDRRQSYSGGSSSESRRRQYQRYSRSEDSDGDDSLNGKRKRSRPSNYYGANLDDETPRPTAIQGTQPLRIGDESEVRKFYHVRFKDMQQSSCKVMGKAFVKLVEPKKQTHHPYTKGDEQAPPWWPPTTGDFKVRHREPDHLLKPERIELLVHILRMIVEPHDQQHDTVKKLGLNVKKLEEVTMEVMTPWFNDKDHQENLKKRPFLKEIFKVAKLQERYKNGEIDAATKVHVMCGDINGLDKSDDDDEEEEGIKDEEDEPENISALSLVQSPENSFSPSTMQSPQFPSPPQSEPESTFSSRPMESSLGRPIPVRFHTQPQVADQTSYGDAYLTRNISSLPYQPQHPSLGDSTRRNFSPGFQPTQQNVYNWSPNSMVSPGSEFYVTSPQSTIPSQSPTYPQLPPMSISLSSQQVTQHQNVMNPLPHSQSQPHNQTQAQHHFNGLPSSSRYETAPALGNQALRTGSLGHPHQLHAQAGNANFQHYLQTHGAYGGNEDLKGLDLGGH